MGRTYNYVSELRSKFSEVKAEAEVIARTWNVIPEFQEKRQPKIKHHFDELAKDYHFTSTEDMFRINIFNVVIDTISCQLHERFKSMEKVRNNFGLLEPQKLATFKNEDILQECVKLQNKYSSFLSEQFPLQFMHVYSLITSELKELQSIKDFANLVMTKYNFMETDISDVFSVFILFFTLPVTVASVERSFSKLKLIKEYKRNSTGQLRLKDL